MSAALAFVRRDFLANASYRLSFVMQFLAIFFGVVTFYYVAQVFGASASPLLQAYGGNYFAFVLIGIAFSDYLYLSLSTFASSIREGQTMGTLEMMLLSPLRLPSILVSSSIWGYLFTSLRVALYLLLGTLVFGIALGNANVPAALAVFFLSILSFCGLGILSASFVVVLKKGDPISWAFGSLSSLLGGVFYPVSVLPDWLQPLSGFLPLTYSLDGMRLALLQGYTVLEVWRDIAFLALFAAILLPAGALAFRLAVRRAKVEGSLSQY
ncbi:MAG: ABC transporter permease [Dehalococcoidia bacterium]|nr:ABC transporter permease [Dehalococcoidia bacterium]